MSRNFSIAGLTNHASVRVFERTRLTASEVAAMLEKKHFYWAETPKYGKSSYALVYDALAGQYVVAVVAAHDRNIKTLLTLEQFERTYHTVSHAAKLLARLAIFAGEKPEASTASAEAPEVEPTKVELAVKVAAPLAWRFVVSRQDGSEVALPVLSHEEVCEKLLFVFPVQNAQDLKRRAERVIQTQAFLVWFANSLPDVGVETEEVGGLRVEVLDEESPRFSRDLTQSFAQLLSSCNTASINVEARRAGRHARKAFLKSRQQEQRQKTTLQTTTRKSAYAVDLMFA